jgi:hypothetical protein
MEGGPPGSPCRRRSQTAAVSCRSRAGVGSDCGDGPQTAGQVSDEKTNMSEPLLTHRNKHDGIETGECGYSRDNDATSWSSSRVRERPACGPGGVRCIGGVSSSQALAWNRRTCRLGMATNRGTGSRFWLPRGRTPMGESTDPRHRGGPARSSGEGLVMGPERRGRAGQVNQRSTLLGRS